MVIGGYQKTTLLDYPGHVAATVFTYGCNFRCPFCHNSGLLGMYSCPRTEEEEVLAFLKKRKNILTGVCITGGEPTLQQDLIPFLQKIKALGYKIKLDTNGYLPQILSSLLEKELLDYIAMDIKSGPSGYTAATGLQLVDFSRITESIRLIEGCGLSYEFRTTLVREFHGEQDLLEITGMLSPASPYYLQCFRDGDNVLQSGLHAHDEKHLQHFLTLVQRILPKAALRGVR